MANDYTVTEDGSGTKFAAYDDATRKWPHILASGSGQNINIYNVTVTTLNTEYSQALPAVCFGFDFWAQTTVALRWSFTTGKVATPTAPWMVLPAGSMYSSGLIHLASATLYLASPSSGPIVNIVAWS